MKFFTRVAFCLSLFTNAFTQTQVNNNINPFYKSKWRTNFVLGTNTYGSVLMHNSLEMKGMDDNPYGAFIEFLSDSTFVSYNQGFCGNECRIRVTGSYAIHDTSISFYSMRLNYTGFSCSNSPVPKNSTDNLFYHFKKAENGFVLSKR